MRPMTAREALEIERDPEVAQHLRPSDWTHARRILGALVEWREAELKRQARWQSRPVGEGLDAVRKWMRPAFDVTHAAESKLYALERGEEPQS